MKISFIAVLSAFFFIGCASTVQYVSLPDQKKPLEDSSKCRIYVYRPSTYGYSNALTIADGNQVIGRIGPVGYLCWERDPGDICINGNAENTSTVTITAKKGGVYYIWERIEMGIFQPRNELEIVEPNRGKAEMKDCSPPKVN